MAKLFNLARVTTATTGTGTITLGSAVSGYLTFALAGVSNGDVVSYGIKDGANSEVGIGTYTSSGTTLTRTVTKSTNSNAAISLSGAAEVYITIRAEDLSIPSNPQGRLTLTSGTAVMTTSVAAASTVYFTPSGGNIVPIYDGSSFAPTPFTEMSQATTDTTKSPAAATTNSNYDMFLWVDAGVVRCTRGPAWTSDTVRSAGTALVLVNGIYLNNASITNGPAASRGTYVGTIRTNGSSTVDWILGTAATGGGAAFFGVWNAYNRVPVKTIVSDTSVSWTYATVAWRAANGSSTIRVSAVRGLDIDGIDAEYSAVGSAGASTTIRTGVGLDKTNGFSGTSDNLSVSSLVGMHGKYSGLMGLGWHYISAVEYNSTTTASTSYGTAGDATQVQSGLHASLWQ